jgi:16S rRNA processing protein RimM
VGRIAKAFGLRGEVIVDALSNRPGRFAPGSVLFAGSTELVITRAHRHGHGQRWIVAFSGVGTRREAEELRGQVLRAEPQPTRRGELWVHELVGATVFDAAGARLGEVTSVEANPASDLLVLDSGALIPLTFVLESAADRIVVDPPAGLLEL